jgi:hypothetical protein
MTVPGGYVTAQFTPADLVAITAAYDQLFALSAGLPGHEAQLRAQLLNLTPGRAAVGSLVTLGGIVSYLYRPDLPPGDYTRLIVESALQATHYRELGR